MDNLICCACKQSFKNLAALHRHVKKKEELELEQYYHLYFPKKDLLTGEMIAYKDNDQYFSSTFSSKENMGMWFKANLDTDKARNLGKELLRVRAERKKMKYAPSQVELRTVDTPSIVTYNKLFDYNSLCQDLGLKTRFDYRSPSLQPFKEIKILVDTREQNPFKFKDSVVRKLDVGDYTAAEPNYADIYIDRKSPEDFFGTFFAEQSVARFTREVERAKSYGFYLFVVVETSINNALNYQSTFFKVKHFPLLTFHNVRELLQKFDNLQFVFAQNRFTAQQLTTIILNQGEAAKGYDWQFLVDTKGV
jgi:hypothetical protein